MTPDEKLIYMANQIAGFFAAQGEEHAVAGVADHIRKFWDPQMRRELVALAAGDAKDMQDVVRKALPLLKEYSAAR
jgi:formate dehydrogenase subunit delta